MELKKRWVAVVVIALVLAGAMQAASIRPSVVNGQAGGEDSDAPYLYYFSDDLNAWVIEQADGTDRRLLGQGLMPEGTNAVGGPGWSPSGKFFAWTSYTGGNYGQTANVRAWVYDVINREIVFQHGMREDLTWIQLAWSPKSDLLMVAERGEITRVGGDNYFYETRFSLVNPADSTVLASLSIQSSIWPQIQWTHDGHYAIAWARSIEESMTQFFLFDTQGGIIERVLPYNIREMPSTSGNLLIYTPDGLILENLLSGEEIQLAWPPDSDAILGSDYAYSIRVVWNRAGTKGLFYGAWLLDTTTNRIQQITPRKEYYGSASWSPDEKYIFVGFGEADSVDGYGYLVDLTTGRAFDLPYYPSVAEFQGGRSWADNQNLVIYGVNYSSEDARLTGTSVTWVDLATGQFITDSLSYLVSVMDVSPNAQYLGWVDEGTLIFDRETNEVTSVQPNAHSYGTFRGGEIRWLDDTWLIEYKDPLIAGGRGLSRWVRVMRSDGTGERELTFCYDPTSCIGILPDTVDPTLIPLAPITPQIRPVQTIHETVWTQSLIWSPDGQVLAVSSGPNYPNYGNRYRLYEMGTGHLQREFNVEENYYFDWELTADNQYVPTQIAVPERTYWQGLFVWVESPDGKFVLAGKDATWGIYDIRIEALVFTPPDREVVFSPDSNLLLTVGSWGSTSIIWDTETWTEVAELPMPITAAAFSPNGEYLAVGVSWDVEIWRVRDLIGAGIQEN